MYIGILLDSEDKPRTVRFLGREIAWYGLVKTFVLLGNIMCFLHFRIWGGFLGAIINSSWFRYVMGIIIIPLGVHQMELINIKPLQMQKKMSPLKR